MSREAPKPRDPAALVAAAKALSDAATPGPWTAAPDRNDQQCVYADDGQYWIALLPHQCVASIEDEQRHNAAFIARARTIVPELAAALEEATAAKVDARQSLQDIHSALAFAKSVIMSGESLSTADEVHINNTLRHAARCAAALGENGGVSK